MARIKEWIINNKPSKRRLIQLYSALLYNAHIKGFITGDIYVGKMKFACSPGLNCYSCPGAVLSCPLGALQNAIASSSQRTPYYILGIILLFGITLGRTICGYLCPVGLLQELLHKIPTYKVKKNRITRILSYLKYIILFVFVILIPLWYSFQNYPLPAFCKYICPAGTFEGAIGLLSNPANHDKLSMLGLLFTRKFVILSLIILAAVFIYRAFCRFLCPLGALYGLFAKISLAGVRVERPKCTDCGRCVSICPVDIKRVGDSECVNCGKCIDTCPHKAISFKVGNKVLIQPKEESERKTGKRAKLAWSLAILFLIVVILIVNLDFNKGEEAIAKDSETQYQVPSEVEGIPYGSEVGMRAMDFTVPLYGESPLSFTLSENLGSKVVINFWATWCSPCIAELPHFEEFHDNHPEISLIAIHSDLVTSDVEEYLSGYDYSFLFGLDETGDIIKSFGGSRMLPQTVILDENGIIIYNSVGSITLDKLENLII